MAGETRGVADGAGAAVSIGSFDGVHRGHMTLIGHLLVAAGETAATPTVVTFDPHPRCIVDPAGCPPLLTLPEEREELLHRAGVEQVLTLHFDEEVSRWSPERFCEELVRRCAPRVVVEGAGFAFGHRRAGTLEYMREYGAAHGFSVLEVRTATHQGDPVSSSRIRQNLLDGRLGEANAMLGRVYTLPGTIVSGESIGRRLGYPTANLEPAARRCIPGDGVYAAWLEVDGTWHPAAASIGTRPTFSGGGTRAVEAFVLDFEGDLYDKEAQLAFARRIRAQRRFTSEKALSDAIGADVQRVREVLRRERRPA